MPLNLVYFVSLMSVSRGEKRQQFFAVLKNRVINCSISSFYYTTSMYFFPSSLQGRCESPFFPMMHCNPRFKQVDMKYVTNIFQTPKQANKLMPLFTNILCYKFLSSYIGFGLVYFKACKYTAR